MCMYCSFFCDLDTCAVFEDCDDIVCLLLPGVVWIAINVVLVLIGSYIVTYHAVNNTFHLQNQFKPVLSCPVVFQLNCYVAAARSRKWNPSNQMLLERNQAARSVVADDSDSKGWRGRVVGLWWSRLWQGRSHDPQWRHLCVRTCEWAVPVLRKEVCAQCEYTIVICARNCRCIS